MNGEGEQDTSFTRRHPVRCYRGAKAIGDGIARSGRQARCRRVAYGVTAALGSAFLGVYLSISGFRSLLLLRSEGQFSAYWCL